MTRFGLWGAIALLALPLAACTGDDPEGTPDERPSAAETARTRDKPLRAPDADVCHRLGYADALQPTVGDTAVKCARPHTARTIAVARLDMTTRGHFLAVDSARVRRQPGPACASAFADHVGGTEEQRRLSMLSVVAFTPTVEQADLGADWIRCDLVAVVAPEELGNLPGPLAGVLDTPAGRDRFGMCGTAKPGSDDFKRVACSREHAWRAVETVDIPPGAKGRWPGKKTAQAVGQEPCTEAARGSATDALSYEWGYEWPDKQQWQAGRTYGFCWAPA